MRATVADPQRSSSAMAQLLCQTHFLFCPITNSTLSYVPPLTSRLFQPPPPPPVIMTLPVKLKPSLGAIEVLLITYQSVALQAWPQVPGGLQEPPLL
ncbi:unnamed protein product, partial [Dibothriocephalus latus]